MKRFPFVPSKDSVPIGIEVVKVIFWWASEWQSVAIFFLKIFLCLITHLLTKLFIFCHSGVIDALQTQTRKAYWELPVSQFSQGKSCFIFFIFFKTLSIYYVCIYVFCFFLQYNRFLRERGMASTSKMEYQFFLCIFSYGYLRFEGNGKVCKKVCPVGCLSLAKLN